jgi:hypothetical protein
VRKAAIEVLTSLRLTEERFRVERSEMAFDEATDTNPSRASTPAAGADDSGILAAGERLYNLETDDDRDEAFFFAERGGDMEATRKPWEERLCSGEEGWLYRDDVTLAELSSEREKLARYLDVVETVVFAKEGARRTGSLGQRAWNIQLPSMGGRRSSAGGRLEQATASNKVSINTPASLDEVDEEQEGGLAEEKVASWARDDWHGMEMGSYQTCRSLARSVTHWSLPTERDHEFLLRHLPLDLCTILPSPGKDAFERRLLERLS